MTRRLKFTTILLISHMLLMALGIAWLVHMAIIAMNGSVYFIEKNAIVLWAEISAAVIVILFSAYVLIIQIQRLGERRKGDRRA
jgi:biotin transporter BioY